MKREFTPKWLDAVLCPPEKARVIFTDSMAGGLRLRVTPNSKTFVVDYTVEGKRKTYKIGKYPEVKLKTAREVARSVTDGAARGVDPNAAPVPTIAPPTVADMLAKYDTMKLSRLRGREEVKRCLNKELAAHLSRPIADVTRFDLNEIVDLVKLRSSDARSNRVRAYIRAFFNWADTRVELVANPADRMANPEKEHHRDRKLTVKEVQAIYNTGLPIVQMLVLTAARRSEIADLKWSEVVDGWIQLSEDRTKNGKPHVIPLSPEAMAIIEAQPRTSDYVFADRVLNRVKASLPVFDTGDYRLHDLRRAFATHSTERGARVEVVELCLGHSLGNVLGRIVATYNQAELLDARRSVLESWSRLITGVETNVIQIGNRR
ncbi:Site-specific recombinase XerD [Pseudosulfitobacter pseudonitzschiae]|uniref:Tyr recombinase domain-containing protein n=1 Tax=Pseudosulfitobacter pseudonitzschiae TaxID=1402135 RepID=A0A073J3R0_9RHOB|nr:integrase family protein [Pseudosulfitobacter pseudonitzschiae]KEJ96321.1 hypothetical protein SUH3_18850 [Pseudosulfitobacter pseudonitzschiae]SHF04920.1 Site-specific recombinase XerD [Pseudosulfitobacter pseudonitzschiae]